MAVTFLSLVEAIKQKYDPDCSDKGSTFKYVKEVAVSQKPGDWGGRDPCCGWVTPNYGMGEGGSS